MIITNELPLPIMGLKHVYLIGLMGSGKSSLGRKLARRLSYDFIDLDEYIENQENRTIDTIFSDQGESHFRILESKAIKQINQENLVISCGGGTPCFHDNMEFMNQNGTTIYLDVQPQILASRLINSKNQRPLLANLNESEIANKLSILKAQREAFYNKANLKIINVSYGSKQISDLVAKLKTLG